MKSNTTKVVVTGTGVWAKWVIGLCVATIMFATGNSLIQQHNQPKAAATDTILLVGLGPKNNIDS